MKYVLNFGLGVNSTAMLIELLKDKSPIDLIVFADTGDEQPETYLFYSVVQEWLTKQNKIIEVVNSQYGRIYDYYFNKKTIPFRKIRDCTNKFKIIPFRWEKFRKKPIIIRALRIDKTFSVKTKEGLMTGKKGDWLIKGVEGELYPCDNKIFKKTYEAVE